MHPNSKTRSFDHTALPPAIRPSSTSSNRCDLRHVSGASRLITLLVLTASLGTATPAATPPQATPAATDPVVEPRARNHLRVDYFIDESGREQPVRTQADWAKRRADILVGFYASTGELPDRSTLGPVRYTVVEGSRAEGPGFTREKLMIDADDGDHIPAWLLRPTNASPGTRGPAVIALHQTHFRFGKDEIIGLAGSPNLAYARELAQRGFVVIAPEFPTLGEYKYDFSKDRYPSGTLKGVWNHMRCVDLLSELPDVDPQRIAAIGHSLGGHNAIWLSVVDTRIRAIVSSCGWTPTPYYKNGDLKGWEGERYLPRFLERYGNDPARVPWDFPELLAALAPRGFFSNSPIGDTNFAVEGVRLSVQEASKIYALFGVPERLQVRYPDCGHDFPPEIREEAYRFIEAELAKP
jgi:acetyl esterase/lipase